MIEEAQKKVQELGLMDSLPRRHAALEDITVNNVIFANRDAKKNAIADEDEQTSYEFDEFFAEVVSKWAQDGLTDEKAQLLLNLIDSADGSVDDSEDAMLEELSMAELTGVDISEILKDKFPDYFE